MVICLPVLDLQNHHRLVGLYLVDLPISGLVLPGQEESPLRFLKLEDLVLSHDSLVKVCGSLSSCSGLYHLWLRLSCSDQSGNCLPVLDLQNHHRLETLYLFDLPVSGLVLPGQEESPLKSLGLEDLVLSHDSLVKVWITIILLCLMPALS